MQHKKDGATKKIGWVYLKMAAISSPYTFDKTIATIEFLVKFWVKYMPKVQTASLSLVLKYLLTYLKDRVLYQKDRVLGKKKSAGQKNRVLHKK